jgi:hypothetical protein
VAQENLAQGRGLSPPGRGTNEPRKTRRTLKEALPRHGAIWSQIPARRLSRS